MSFCEKWRAVGPVPGLSPVVLAFQLTLSFARHPRRWWQDVLLAFVVALPLPVVGRGATLVAWNGIRPALRNN